MSAFLNDQELQKERLPEKIEIENGEFVKIYSKQNSAQKGGKDVQNRQLWINKNQQWNLSANDPAEKLYTVKTIDNWNKL